MFGCCTSHLLGSHLVNGLLFTKDQADSVKAHPTKQRSTY